MKNFFMIRNITNIKVKSIEELSIFLSSIDTQYFNLINYVWIEYGFYPIIFNDLFESFFKNIVGKKIGICFPGHEVFYEPHVDILITLDGFINTTKAYSNNQETELLINNFKNESDRGVAFWFTVRNFDEDLYQKTINNFKFRNVIYPIGKRIAWENDLFILKPGYEYGSGEDGSWKIPSNKWNSTKTLGWELESWNPYFERVTKFNLKKYNSFFVKNSWKSRNYSSNNLDDFLVGENGTSGKGGWGFVDYDFFSEVINFHINNKMDLVVINDLSSFPEVKNEHIHYLNMSNFFDTKLFLTVVDESNTFISTSTSPIDLASYYCNTNLVLINDKQNKNSFVNEIQKIKNKNSISFEYGVENINKLFDFIKWI
jgi:hypothetical protein